MALRCPGEKAISYCFTLPPKELTSTTPGIMLSCRFTVQSSMVRSSCGVYCEVSAWSVYCNISPSPVLMGPISGVPKPSGMSPLTWLSFSCTSSRGR